MSEQDTAQAVKAALDSVITDAIDNHPRSLQLAIGPSDLGDPCDVCLSKKLAGIKGPESEHAWKARVGTFIHAGLEADFDAENARLGGTDADKHRWVLERKVHVGNLDDLEVRGSSDLYDRQTNSVVDWKTASKYVLKEVRSPSAHDPAGGRKQGNRVQAHLYGRGYALLGYPVERVALYYLPRDGMLTDAEFWSEPYDERVALLALERGTNLRRDVLVAQAGGDLDEYLSSLQPWDRCYPCGRHVKAERLGQEEGRITTGFLAGMTAAEVDPVRLALSSLRAATDRDQVVSLWREGADKPWWTADLLDQHRQRWSALTA